MSMVVLPTASAYIFSMFFKVVLLARSAGEVSCDPLFFWLQGLAFNIRPAHRDDVPSGGGLHVAILPCGASRLDK